jgi:hypothetical protein
MQVRNARARAVLVSGGVIAALAWSSAGCSAEAGREGFEEPAGSSGGTAGEGGGGGSSGAPAPDPGRVGCAGDAYAEDLPTSASLADLSFSSDQAQEYFLAALERRFPNGKFITEGGIANPLPGNPSCFNQFVGDTSSAASVLRRAPTLVHECGHFYDLGTARGAKSAYIFTPELDFICDGGDTTKRNGKTFERSRINGDEYASKHAMCANQSSQGCDFYARVYLDGDPDDAQFQGGDQGYNSVLEEATQYVNSLATALAFKETYEGLRVSERDGLLTFFWYVERYLKMAREEYPAAYAHLSEDACWRQATLTMWDRGWFFLEATKDIQNLGINDAKLQGLVEDPDLLAEIDALRALECQ